MSEWPWDLTLEVAFDVNPGVNPGVGDWTDLSSRIRSSIQSSVGRDRTGSPSGSFKVDLNNRDRELDPTYSGSSLNVVPMRHARLQATVDTTVYDVWRGFVEAWNPQWAYNEGIVVCRMVDGFAWIALQDADLDLPAQKSGARIGALLDAAGWPATLRDIDGGIVPLDAYEQSGGNLFRVLEDTADAEDGNLWIAPDGKITFRDRHARFDTASAQTVGDGGIPFTSVDTVFDTAMLTNEARVELADGDTFTAVDDSSQTLYGPRSLPIRDLSLSDAQAEGLAQWVVYRFAVPHMWLDNLSMNGRAGSVLAAMLARSVGDRVTFVNTPPGTGTAEVTGHIERVSHSVGRGTWMVEVDVTPYHGAGPWLTLDDASLGLLGATAANKIAP